MTVISFYKRVFWAEMFALVFLPFVTILPIKLGYTHTDESGLNATLYYAAAMFVIVCANVAYVAKSPIGTRLKVAPVSIAVLVFVSLPWISQREGRLIDFSGLRQGDGVPSLLLFGIGVAVINYLAAAMTLLKADRKGEPHLDC